MRLLFWMVLVSPLLCTATALASVQISEAKWKAGDGKLVVKANGQWSGSHDDRERVKVFDADNDQKLFGRRVEVHGDGAWQMEAKKLLASAPCRIRRAPVGAR